MHIGAPRQHRVIAYLWEVSRRVLDVPNEVQALGSKLKCCLNACKGRVSDKQATSAMVLLCGPDGPPTVGTKATPLSLLVGDAGALQLKPQHDTRLCISHRLQLKAHRLWFAWNYHQICMAVLGDESGHGLIDDQDIAGPHLASCIIEEFDGWLNGIEL